MPHICTEVRDACIQVLSLLGPAHQHPRCIGMAEIIGRAWAAGYGVASSVPAFMEHCGNALGSIGRIIDRREEICPPRPEPLRNAVIFPAHLHYFRTDSEEAVLMLLAF